MGKYKKELLFTLAVLAAAAGLWLATHAGRGTGNVAVVRYGDPQVEQRIDLSQNADYDIDTGTYTVHLHVENGGIAFVDVANLTPANIVDGRLSYKRQKTHGAINVPLSEKAKAIIGKYDSHCEQAGYLFPILDERAHITPLQKKNRVHKMCSRVNVALRDVAKRLKIKATVTTYVARHSFATVLKKSGVNIGIISEALGHHSLKTTQIYLGAFENSQIDAAMQNLL